MSAYITDYRGGYQPREWRVAWRALRSLIREQQDTDQVFIIMKALGGNSHDKQFKRFLKSNIGQRVLAERTNILDKLEDRTYLASLPDESLGREYLAFIKDEKLSADALIKASEIGRSDIQSQDLIFYFDRSRDVHDLWHVLTGYGRDGFGEACVVAYSYAQTKSLGFAAIALMGGYEFKKAMPKNPIWGAIWQAYRNGRKSNWLMGEAYEELLPMNLDEVRQKLNIHTPDKYLACPDVIGATRGFTKQ